MMKHNTFLSLVIACLVLNFGAVGFACDDDKGDTCTVGAPAKGKTDEKAEWRRTVDTQLDQIEANISDLKKSAAETSGETKAALNDKIAILENHRNAIKADLAKTSDNSARAWNKFKQGVQKSVTDLQKGFADAKEEFTVKTAKATKASKK